MEELRRFGKGTDWFEFALGLTLVLVGVGMLLAGTGILITALRYQP